MFVLVTHRLRRRPAMEETGGGVDSIRDSALGTEVGFCLVREARLLVGPRIPEHPQLRHGPARARERAL